MTISVFTGGIFDTNCFLAETSSGLLLFDAPDGVADWLRATGRKPTTLLLTHGHIDHIWDAAEIQREFGCNVGIHPDSAPMVRERGFFRNFGFEFEVEPLEPDLSVEEGLGQMFGGDAWDVFEVPGHCPGSLCFFSHEQRLLIGGDVLFAGGVGRWDLPGGDRDLLLNGIRKKLFPLGDDVIVHPGHGPATTIGEERRTNPYLTGVFG
jgi:hydroxyacylglutathione hydrolase